MLDLPVPPDPSGIDSRIVVDRAGTAGTSALAAHPLHRAVEAIIPQWVTRWRVLSAVDGSAVLYVVPGEQVGGEAFRILRVALRDAIHPTPGRLRAVQELPEPGGEGTGERTERTPAGIGNESSPDPSRAGGEPLLAITPLPVRWQSTVRGSRASKGRPESPHERFRDVRKTLPLDVELLRPLQHRFHLPRGTLDMLLLKMYVPPEKESSLLGWRDNFEARHGVTVAISRAEVVANMRSQLLNLGGSAGVLDRSSLPRIATVLDNLCGKPPPTPTAFRLPGIQRVETGIRFVAMDRPGTHAEDLLYAELLPSGNYRLLTAYPDVTHIIRPGDDIDHYAQRVGASYYSSRRCISTIGTSLAWGDACFPVGEPRAAWVVELFVSPNGEILNARSPSVYRWLVSSHRSIDPDGSDFPAMTVEDPVLKPLTELARLLNARRLQRTGFERIEGEGLGHMVVGECMIASKAGLGTFSAAARPIYKIHTPPTDHAKHSLVTALTRIGVPATIEDLDEPIRLAAIVRCLETRNGPDSNALAATLLDIYQLRSLFSLENVGHFALGVDSYIEIKPRDAAGLANQFQLDRYFRGLPPLDDREFSERVATRNRKKRTRDETLYKLMFYEMLEEHLDKIGERFRARPVQVRDDLLMLDVDGFTKWGYFLLGRNGSPGGLPTGGPFSARLNFFSTREMRFNFTPCPEDARVLPLPDLGRPLVQ